RPDDRLRPGDGERQGRAGHDDAELRAGRLRSAEQYDVPLPDRRPFRLRHLPRQRPDVHDVALTPRAPEAGVSPASGARICVLCGFERGASWQQTDKADAEAPSHHDVTAVAARRRDRARPATPRGTAADRAAAAGPRARAPRTVRRGAEPPALTP